jgi:hypothetical protein
MRRSKVKKSRSIKSEYDGIKFDSNLEIYCYKKLKENNITFEYVPETYILIPAFKTLGDSWEADKRVGKLLTLKSKSIQSIKYTPDFVGENWIIETKGAQTDVFNMRYKLFKKYLTDNKLDYILFMPKNHIQVDQAIEIIIKQNGETT